MSTMGLHSMGDMGSAKDAGVAKEFNTNNAYYIMKNKKGREVPVAITRLNEVLKQGYSHTDGVVKSDDLSLQVQAQHTSPTQQLADVAKAMAAVSESMADPEVMEAVKEKRKRRSSAELKLENA